jgi:CheY-like chemotaxis protein
MARLNEVLILDSDAQALETLAYGFQGEGCQVVTAAAAQEMREQLARALPQVVVVALRDPVDLGLETVRWLRENGATARLPVVVLGPASVGVDLAAVGGNGGNVDLFRLPTFVRDVITASKVLASVQPRGEDEQAMSGALSDFGTFFLVRTLTGLRRSAIIQIERSNRRGEIRLTDGEVTWAQVGHLQGPAALNQLLLWEEAALELRLRPVARRAQAFKRGDDLLDEMERFLRDFAHATKDLGSIQALFVQDPEKSIEALDAIPVEIVPVVRLFDGHRTLGDIIEDSPFRVFDTLRTVTRLFELGLIRRKAIEKPSATGARRVRPEEWAARGGEGVVPGNRGAAADGSVRGPMEGTERPDDSSDLTAGAQAAPDLRGGPIDRRKTPRRAPAGDAADGRSVASVTPAPAPPSTVTRTNAPSSGSTTTGTASIAPGAERRPSAAGEPTRTSALPPEFPDRAPGGAPSAAPEDAQRASAASDPGGGEASAQSGSAARVLRVSVTPPLGSSSPLTPQAAAAGALPSRPPGSVSASAGVPGAGPPNRPDGAVVPAGRRGSGALRGRQDRRGSGSLEVRGEIRVTKRDVPALPDGPSVVVDLGAAGLPVAPAPGGTTQPPSAPLVVAPQSGSPAPNRGGAGAAEQASPPRSPAAQRTAAPPQPRGAARPHPGKGQAIKGIGELRATGTIASQGPTAPAAPSGGPSIELDPALMAEMDAYEMANLPPTPPPVPITPIAAPVPHHTPGVVSFVRGYGAPTPPPAGTPPFGAATPFPGVGALPSAPLATAPLGAIPAAPLQPSTEVGAVPGVPMGPLTPSPATPQPRGPVGAERAAADWTAQASSSVPSPPRSSAPAGEAPRVPLPPAVTPGAPGPGNTRPSGEFDPVEKDFFAREADIYAPDAADALEDHPPRRRR